MPMQILISRHTPALANIVFGFIPPGLSLLNLSKESAPSIFLHHPKYRLPTTLLGAEDSPHLL